MDEEEGEKNGGEKRRRRMVGDNVRYTPCCPGKGVASGFETQNASQRIPGTFVRAMRALYRVEETF